MTFASGDTYLYFIQPAISNVVIASLALLSLATARPFVARLAADFYPMTDDLAMRPRLQRLFWHLTLMWAMVCLAKAVHHGVALRVAVAHDIRRDEERGVPRDDCCRGSGHDRRRACGSPVAKDC